MNKRSLLINFFIAFFCVNCSDSINPDLVGTVEDPNEIAEIESSNSLKSESSSSCEARTLDPVQSSSSAKTRLTSSSSNDTPIPISSSNAANNNQTSSPSLEDYISNYSNNDAKLDNYVLATKNFKDDQYSALQPNNSPKTLYSDGIHKISNDKLSIITELYPTTHEQIIQNVLEITDKDPSCSLYLYNMHGNNTSVGYVLAIVTSDSLTIQDILSSECAVITPQQIVNFAFVHCGEESYHPQITHVTVNGNYTSDNCPNIYQDIEWVKQ